MLRLAAAQLAPGGLLVVVTPDVGSVPARVLGERWWHFRLAHVGYFDARSFMRLAEACDLVVRHRSRARWFFRVRYLAERVAEYLPVAWLNRAADRIPALQWLYGRVITVDLRDSFVWFLEASHA
jgi:hypothetical protein